MKTNAKQIIALRNSQAGNTLLVALLMLSVLSVVGANVLVSVSSRYQYTQKAVGWSEALSAAEAGADYGLANCRWKVVSGSPTSWNGWKIYDSGTSSSVTVDSSTDTDYEFDHGHKFIYDLPTGSHLVSTGSTGETTDLWYHVEVDSPTSTFVVSGNRWYRIRATGYAGLAKFATRAGEERKDASSLHPTFHNDILRKFDLVNDHFIARYGDYSHAANSIVPVAPQATRRVEMIARPRTTFSYAIATVGAGATAPDAPLLDSWDPYSYPLTYALGLYDPLPRTLFGFGKAAKVYVDAPISSYAGNLYGDLQTNNGTVGTGNPNPKPGNISGNVSNDVVQSIPPVTAPGWAGAAGGAAPSTITAGTTASPSHGSYTSMNNVTVALPSEQTKGIADIYVAGPGNITGTITVNPGVTARIWFEGDMTMKPTDIRNLNINVIDYSTSAAQYLQFYGITPPAGQTRTVTIQSAFLPGILPYFTLDAPGYDMTVNGSPDLMGSFVVKSLNSTGSARYHYDERLATAGPVYDYYRATWIEDPR